MPFVGTKQVARLTITDGYSKMYVVMYVCVTHIALHSRYVVHDSTEVKRGYYFPPFVRIVLPQTKLGVNVARM